MRSRKKVATTGGRDHLESRIGGGGGGGKAAVALQLTDGTPHLRAVFAGSPRRSRGGRRRLLLQSHRGIRHAHVVGLGHRAAVALRRWQPGRWHNLRQLTGRRCLRLDVVVQPATLAFYAGKYLGYERLLERRALLRQRRRAVV